jgi:putative hemolysin
MDEYTSSAFVTFLIIVFLLIITSGIFILFDSALSLCRKSRLEKERKKRYKAVLKILENPPDRLQIKWSDRQNLSLACRLWNNIIKIFAAFLGGFTCVNFIISGTDISIWVITAIYILVLGIIAVLLSDEIPKLLSRIKPEKITATLLPVMKILSIPMIPFTLPALKLFSFFNSAFKTEIDDSITEDELRDALIEGEKSGIVETKERSMVEGVFYLGDRTVGAFMTHRSEIQWLDINTPYNEIKDKALEYRTQRCFPVVNGSPDEIAGAVYLEDIILDLSQPTPQGLRSIIKKAQFVPETMTALKAFESFKQGQIDFLFVMDEYGGLAGIISVRALVEEIVGELSAPVRKEAPLKQQADDVWLAEGTLSIDDAAKELNLTDLPEGDDFHTLAGFILHLAGELPGIGDNYEYQGYRFTVKKMDGNRIDKLLITKLLNNSKPNLIE